MGADVIKIEVPGTGDLARKMGADPELNGRQMGASFLAINAGKRSVTLDLKSAEGKALFFRLLEGADVVLENFRPGTMNRLGLGDKVLRARKPGLIYCAVSGFGQDGPMAARASYDQIIQGFCGLMSLTGAPETTPNRAGYVVCDTAAAILAAFAIAAALVRRERTGEGETIDVSMADSALSTMAVWVVSNYTNANRVAAPMGNDSHSAAPSGTFRTKDGALNIVNNEQKQFEALCSALGTPDWLEDGRFATREARMRNREELRLLLEMRLQEDSSANWERKLAALGVPVGQILTVAEAVDHPQTRARGLVQEVDVPALGRSVRVTAPGFQIGHAPVAVSGSPPTLGEHTREVLAGIGCDAQEYERLRQQGIV
jgi:crotonobetainyl-CoA:carnitine CoA-transferase CaiB-like acyl-CoA transferase